jgi:hypothetical protein
MGKRETGALKDGYIGSGWQQRYLRRTTWVEPSSSPRPNPAPFTVTRVRPPREPASKKQRRWSEIAVESDVAAVRSVPLFSSASATAEAIATYQLNP